MPPSVSFRVVADPSCKGNGKGANLLWIDALFI